MKKWKKALALLLAMAMCLSMLSVSAFAEGEDPTDPGTEQGPGEGGEGGGPGGDMGGGPGGGSTASGAETIEVSGMEGMLSLEKYVFEDTTGSITVKCYGTYRADSAEGEEAYGVAAADDTYGVYTDSDLTEAADGVTATITEDGDLQITGVATEGNVVYYLWVGETDSVATIIYVVNDEYDENSATLTLANGDTVEITTYAPNMADGDYTASVESANAEGSVYIGANRTATGADYYGYTEDDEYYDAVDWYLSSGITNGGASLEEFGENMYNFEYVVAMYRMFQLVNENMTFTSDFVDASDYVAGMGSNDQFSDAVSATMLSGIWNGIYTQYSSTELPTATEVDGVGYLLENITDENGETVTELGVFDTTTVEFVYVGLFNAFQSAWSQLSDEGEAVAEALAAAAAEFDGETKTAPDDYSNEAKIAAIAKVFDTFDDDGDNPDWNWASEMIYDCVAAGIIEGRDDNTYDTQGNLLRSEAATLIARAYGLTSDATVSSFPDVSSDHWALQYIEACAEAGIILGRDDGTFDPDATITRAEMAAMIARAEGLTSDVSTSSFPDVSSSHWALQEIEACYVAGIVEGDNGNYRPEDNITRAEIAMILGRAIDIGGVDLTKEETVAVLYNASGCVESVSYADSETADAVGSSYADMTQYFGCIYDSEDDEIASGIIASSLDTTLIMASVNLTGVCFGVQSDDTGNVIYAEDANTGIDGMAAAMGGIQAEYADATEGYGFVYNATFRNAYYREGIGSAVAIVGSDTVVNLSSENGSLVLSGSGGSMAGTAYVAFGATLKIANSVAYSSNQHLTNNLYNGTVYYYESLAYGTGRLFSSDFWGGYQVYENSVGYGGNVTDEPTTLIVKNSVYSNSVGGNGYASQYFENSVLNVGTASFHNTTSLITDVGGLTLVNSVLNNTSGTLVSVSKGENVIVTLIDSTINMSGNSVASISASTSINHNASLDKDSEDWVSDEYAAMFDSEVYIYVYGDTTINTTDGTLTADVADGATLKIFVSETNAALEALAASNENIEIVIGAEYGTLTVLVDGLTYNEDGTVSFNAKDFCSFGSGGTSDEDNDYAFTAYLYLSSGAEMYNGTGVSAVDGTYTGIEIEDGISGRNGIVVVDSDTTFDGLTISLITDADGSDTCDFSGKGAALAVYGDSNVTVKNATIETTGVATMPVFVDDGATVTIYSSTLISNGGTLYEDYMNSPDQSSMVAPPWILGIMGTSRCTNLMGNDSTMNVIDSETSAGAWAVLSTDSGSNMYLNIYNTSLTLNNADESAAAPLQVYTSYGQIYETNDNPYSVNYGSGYGTYAIGDAVETFAGATVNVGTYATIFTGGSAVYTNIVEGETYTLASADGEIDITYTASTSKVTTINSDTFGFMIHQSANYITIENGTVVNSGYATFLVKSGSSSESVTATIDNAELNNGGVLIQVMDNDDATNGGMMSSDDENNTNGGNMNFQTTHSEDAGFASSASDADSSVQSFTFTNGTYTGNIYNGSGTDRSTATGALDATNLYVTFGEGATYTGAIASTAAIHVTYEGSVAVKEQGGYAFEDAASAAEFALTYQNTSFDITHYYDIGQVANMILENGAPINITLTDDAVWTVTGTSVISSLTLSGDAKVIVPENVTLTVGGVEYTNTTLTYEVDGLADGLDETETLTYGTAATLINRLMKDSGTTGYNASIIGTETEAADALAALTAAGVITDETITVDSAITGAEFDALLASALLVTVEDLEGVGEFEPCTEASISVGQARQIILSVVLVVRNGNSATGDTNKFLCIESGSTWTPESTSGSLHVAGLIGHDTVNGICAYGEMSYDLETQTYNGLTIYYGPYAGSIVSMASDPNSLEICYVNGGGRLYPDYPNTLEAVASANSYAYNTDVADVNVNISQEDGYTTMVYATNGVYTVSNSDITSYTYYSDPAVTVNMNTLAPGDAVNASTDTAVVNIVNSNISSLSGRAATALAGATLNISGSTLKNTDGNGSHGVCVLYGGVINISDSTVYANTSALSSDFGGGLIVADNVNAYATNRGAGVLADGMTFAYVTNSHLETAQDAGATTAGCGVVDIDGSTIVGYAESSSETGGVLYTYAMGMCAGTRSYFNVSNSSISGNANGIYIQGNTVDMTLTNDTIDVTGPYMIYATNITVPANFWVRANIYFEDMDVEGDIYFYGAYEGSAAVGYDDSYLNVYFGANTTWTGTVYLDGEGTLAELNLYAWDSESESYVEVEYTVGEELTIDTTVVAPTPDNVGTTAGVVIVDGQEDTSAEYTSGITIDAVVTNTAFSGSLSADCYYATGILVSNSTYTISNSNLYLGTDEDDNSYIPEGGGINAGSGIAVRDGSTVTIEDSTIVANGAWGSMDYVRAGVVVGWQSKDNGDVVIMRNTTIENDGNDENTSNVGYFPGTPVMNIMQLLTVSGQGRSYVALGDSVSYLYNDEIKGTGWAAICTDMATDNGLYVYSVGTSGITTYGGYGVYADTNCFDYFYNSTLQGADFGCIISNDGALYMTTLAEDGDAIQTAALAYATDEDIATASAKESVIAGGRNAIMTHATDAGYIGSIDLTNTTIYTSEDIKGQTETMSYMANYLTFTEFCNGADILLKTSSLDVSLVNVKASSYTNTLIMAVVDTDNGGITDEVAAGETRTSNDIYLENVTTDDEAMNIYNYDFQRMMNVEIKNMTLTGALDYYTYAEYMEVEYLGAAQTLQGTEDHGGLSLTIDEDATWVVTETSYLTSLTVNGTITAPEDSITMTVDGTVTEIEAGTTYTGEIVLTVA